MKNTFILIAMGLFLMGVATGLHAQSDSTFIVNGVSFTMKIVPGGEIFLGSQRSNPDLPNYDKDCFEGSEVPVLSTKINTFYIGETEVTRALWSAVMGQRAEWKGKRSDFPATSITWADCQAFITKLNEITGLQFRLPTEAEWEYAARGGELSQGYVYAGGNDLEELGWFMNSKKSQKEQKICDQDIYGNSTYMMPVKMKKPNEIGLYDMCGNVFEWCSDGMRNYKDKQTDNPVGPDDIFKVIRGGSAYSYASQCRVSTREILVKNENLPSRNYQGFRLAVTTIHPE